MSKVKETNLGIPIPQNWKVYSLGEILKERIQKSNDIKSFPLYSLMINGGLTEKTDRYNRTFLLKNKEGNQYLIVQPNDILYNPMNLRFGAIARSKIDFPVAVSAYYNTLRLVEEFGTPVYFEYYLSSYRLFHIYNRVAIGSLEEKKRVHWSILQKVKIPIPSLEERQKIAQILTTWDTAIEKLENLIQKKQKLKKGLMQVLLTGKLRFGEFEGKSASNKKIKEIAFINKKALKGSTDESKEFYYLDLASVKSGNIEFPKEKIKFGDAPSRARRIVKNNDVIMATVRPNLKGFAKIDFDSEDYICSTGFAVLTSKNRVDSEYIYQNLYSRNITTQIENLVVGSNYPAINNKDVGNLKIWFPEKLEERKKIASIFKKLDAEMNVLSKELTKTKTQKKGLMQKLLTGEVRVKI